MTVPGELERLRAENLALHARNRQLEETLAQCVREGVRLRSVIAEYPARQNAAVDAAILELRRRWQTAGRGTFTT